MLWTIPRFKRTATTTSATSRTTKNTKAAMIVAGILQTHFACPSTCQQRAQSLAKGLKLESTMAAYRFSRILDLGICKHGETMSAFCCYILTVDRPLIWRSRLDSYLKLETFSCMASGFGLRNQNHGLGFCWWLLFRDWGRCRYGGYRFALGAPMIQIL